MLPADYYDTAFDDIIELYSQLDQAIIRDIVRRLVKTGGITDTAKWQIERLQESGKLRDEIIKEIARMSGASDTQVQSLFENAGIQSVQYDSAIYKAAGLNPLPLNLSPAALQVLQAGMQKTSGYLRNLTMTTAATSQQAYIQAATRAEMQVESGAFDYVTAIRNAVRSASKAGTEVLYPSGRRDQLDVATRRAVLTGVSQTAGKIAENYADDMGCDLMEITAHPGARPTHAVWQGKLVSRSGRPGYLSLTDIGYGTGPGFKGWNCRHDWFPFFEGLSSSAYPREKLREYENQTVQYNGETIKYYDATQMQRGMERQIRATKRELAGYSEGMKSDNEGIRNAMKEDFSASSVKLKQQEARLRDFTRQTGLYRQREREQVLGFGRSQSGKAVWANKTVLDKYSGYHYNKNGILQVTDDWTGKVHPRITSEYKPYAVIDTISSGGKQFNRAIYDASGKMIKQVHGGDHGHPKQHPFGQNGEHVHDFIRDAAGNLSKTTREWTEAERKEYGDLLKGGGHNDH